MNPPQHPPKRAVFLAVVMAVFGLAAAGALAAQLARQERARFELRAGRAAYAPGDAVDLVASVRIDPGWHVNSDRPTFDYLIPTTLRLELPAGWPPPRVTYPPATLESFAFADQPLSVWQGEVAITAATRAPADFPAQTVPIRAVLRYQACNDTLCLPPVDAEATLSLRIAAAASLPAAAATSPPPADVEAPASRPASLAWILLASLLGGLILNAMPCVLPVLSLKVFGLVRSAHEGRRQVAAAALATSAGILVSFWALAAAAIAARAAGAAVGWGVQFQQPAFVAFLAVVVVLFCLNLWGVFEITLPASVAGAVGGTHGASGAGHFVSGLFATLMATPCSAPFLGTAVSFALGQPPATTLAVFTALGVGMALPYLLLAAAPGTARWLPRPGAWMDTLKGFMGFLLAGTAVWLFYVLAAQIAPERLALLQAALLLLALSAWARGRARSRWRAAASLGMVAAAALTLALAWRGAPAAGDGPRRGPAAQQFITWTPWDRAQAEALAGEGRLVFVDVTADWCFTCKVNERLAVETAETAAAFARHGVVAMKADWTNRDDTIARFLADFGRHGIPFYALYRPGAPPHVFGELLTQDELLRVLAAAAPAPAQ